MTRHHQADWWEVGESILAAICCVVIVALFLVLALVMER